MPTATTNQPTPETPCTGPHASVYIKAVQGAKMIPNTGQIVDEKAALTRSVSKIQRRKNAKRGPMKAIARPRQHTGTADSARAARRCQTLDEHPHPCELDM